MESKSVTIKPELNYSEAVNVLRIIVKEPFAVSATTYGTNEVVISIHEIGLDKLTKFRNDLTELIDAEILNEMDKKDKAIDKAKEEQDIEDEINYIGSVPNEVDCPERKMNGNGK